MATAQELLKIEAGELGYSRWTDPETGTKYGRWAAQKLNNSYLGTNGVPFCAMFQSWCFDQAGQSGPGLPTASCGVIRRAGLAGKALSNKRDAKPGDLVLFRWDGNVNDMSESDHVGMVEVNYGSYIQTIEGNTGNGGVYRRTRSWGVVQMVLRPDYSGTQSNPTHDTAGNLIVDGLWGAATTKRLQEVLGTPADGVISHQWTGNRQYLAACTSGWEFDSTGTGSTVIKAMQAKLGVTADGLIGRDTVNALIKRYQSASGATVLDGCLDEYSITVKAMQAALNEGRF